MLCSTSKKRVVWYKYQDEWILLTCGAKQARYKDHVIPLTGGLQEGKTNGLQQKITIVMVHSCRGPNVARKGNEGTFWGAGVFSVLWKW